MKALLRKVDNNIEICVFIFILVGNILFGGRGITKEQYIPFFSWSLFSNIYKDRREIFIVLPERNNMELIKLSSSDKEKTEIRFAAQQCFKGYNGYSGYKLDLNNNSTPCMRVIQENLKKQKVTRAEVYISEKMHDYLLRYNSSENPQDKKRRSKFLTTMYTTH